tara:strand:+ start:223 stop:807 length:585 start_codon:yes stop_codon:yes gene_type:complete
LYAISAVVPHFSGESSKKLRVTLSLIISLLVVIPHVTRSYPAGLDVVEIINASIPQVVMLIVGVFLTLILIAATVGRGDNFSGYVSWVRWIALILVALIFLDNINFGYGYGYFGNFPLLGWFSDPDLQALLVIIIVFGLIVYFITGDSTTRGHVTIGGRKYASARSAKRDLIDAGLSEEDANRSINSAIGTGRT